MSNFELNGQGFEHIKNSLADISGDLREISREMLREYLKLSGYRGTGVEAARERMKRLAGSIGEQERNVRQLEKASGTVNAYVRTAEIKARLMQGGFAIGNGVLVSYKTVPVAPFLPTPRPLIQPWLYWMSNQSKNSGEIERKLQEVTGDVFDKSLGFIESLMAEAPLIIRKGKYVIIKGNSGQRELNGLLNVNGSRYRIGSEAFKKAGLQNTVGVRGFLKDTFSLNMDNKTAAGKIGTIGKALAYANIIVDTGKNLIENVKNSESAGKIVGDAAGDIGSGLTGMAVSVGASKVAAAIGTAICPGAGTAVGAVVGFVGGAVAGWLYEKYGKTVVKKGISNTIQNVTDSVSKAVQNTGKAVAKWFTKNKFAYA